MHGIIKRCTDLLFEPAASFPKETLPRGEISALEERVLQNAFHATERLNHIRAIIGQNPQPSIVFVVRPPEALLTQMLKVLKLGSHAPAAVVR